MTSLEDLIESTSPVVFTGVGQKKAPKAKPDIPDPPPAVVDRPTVAAAADPDSDYPIQVDARQKAREQLPLPDTQLSTTPMTVQVTGRMKQLISGEITVDDLDDEELMSGQFRDKSGNLNGRSKVVPKAMHQEMQRRLLQRGHEKIRSDFFDAIDVVGSIMRDDQNDPAVRLRAANTIIERTAGKTPEKVEMSVEVKKYEEVAVSIMREIPPEVEEAEIVDDED